MRVVFMGTPDFACASLESLVNRGYDIPLVVTAPDRKGGRGGNQLLESDVKKLALKYSLPIAQPENLKDPQFLKQLRDIQADLFAVVAFRMLPEMVWSMPPLGTINIHGSLLPAYRGAAPIHWAIISGEKETGVTSFLIDREIDTGKILLQKKISIGEDEYFGELYSRLKNLGANLLIETIEGLSSGTIKPKVQDEKLVSYAPKLHRGNCQLHWSQNAAQVFNQIRGLSPSPGAWTWIQGKEFKIFKAQKTYLEAGDYPPCEWIIKDKRLYLPCNDYLLEITELQEQGKRKMNSLDFINGMKSRNSA